MRRSLFPEPSKIEGRLIPLVGKQSGWWVRSVSFSSINEGSTPIDEIFCKYRCFTCSSSLLAYSERGIEDSFSNIPLKNILFFPQHFYISQSDSFGLCFAYNYAHARDTNMAAVWPLTSSENHLYKDVLKR